MAQRLVHLERVALQRGRWWISSICGLAEPSVARFFARQWKRDGAGKEEENEDFCKNSRGWSPLPRNFVAA